jgi:ribosomal protein S14
MTPERLHRRRLRNMTKYYVKTGRIARLPCRACGAPDAQAHHPEYTTPFNVEWLCRKCHVEHHRKENRAIMEAARPPAAPATWSFRREKNTCRKCGAAAIPSNHGLCRLHANEKHRLLVASLKRSGEWTNRFCTTSGCEDYRTASSSYCRFHAAERQRAYLARKYAKRDAAG